MVFRMSLLFPEIKILLFKYLDALQCLAIVDSSEDDCLETEINFMKKNKTWWFGSILYRQLYQRTHLQCDLVHNIIRVKKNNLYTTN